MLDRLAATSEVPETDRLVVSSLQNPRFEEFTGAGVLGGPSVQLCPHMLVFVGWVLPLHGVHKTFVLCLLLSAAECWLCSLCNSAAREVFGPPPPCSRGIADAAIRGLSGQQGMDQNRAWTKIALAMMSLVRAYLLRPPPAAQMAISEPVSPDKYLYDGSQAQEIRFLPWPS